MSINSNNDLFGYNFERDVKIFSDSQVKKLGYMPLRDVDTTQSLVQLFNILRNHISKKPRKVHLSDSFEFPIEYEKEIKIVLSEISDGVDLNRRRSRNQNLKKGYVDGMLLDWGIYHLHIGLNEISRGKNKGLIEGDKYILFCCIYEDDAYVIGLYDHKSWTKSKVLEVVNNNWSFILEPYHLRGVVDVARKVEDSERLRLRNAHINTAVKIGGEFYFAPGGGMTLSGFGYNEVRNALEVMRAMNSVSDWMNSNAEYLNNKVSMRLDSSEKIDLHFNVLKYITSRTMVLYNKKYNLTIYIPSSDEPASLFERDKSLLLASEERDLDYIHPSVLNGNLHIEIV